MVTELITGRDLIKDGWQPGPVVEAALDVATILQEETRLAKVEVMARLAAVRQTPFDFKGDRLFGTLAERLIKLEPPVQAALPHIRETPIPYRIWGDDFEPITLQQMDNAACLPISQAGALMPDGHPGYGLPIGGILATENSIIPYGVGMDIACRLRLSIFNERPDFLKIRRDQLRTALLDNTRFGIGSRVGEWPPGTRRYHPILDDPRWNEIPFLQRQFELAVAQLGTSGTSNHFAEWAALTALENLPQLGLAAGDTRLCFVTHSGSRGVGANIAREYTRIAKSFCSGLPKKYQELAWLNLDSEAGQEYWHAMQVAGGFAAANHETIHQTVIAAAGLEVAAHVENHHNFAWEEEHFGQKLIVHRKGATPAAKGTLGVIPGTMADKGYIVVGLGNHAALHSSSHGAGRPRSRSASKQMITRHQRDSLLRRRGVELLNPEAGVDEAPQAYKNPAAVMEQQRDLVRPVATFMPLMVMMASDKKSRRGKRSKKKRRRG
jgi:tRNA-splicing ligase RtcB